MPKIYLSPSTQEFNFYNGGGTEEYYMNLIADAMIPYLRASGIQYTRNTPEMTAASSIAASNSGQYDLHLALHSNAAPDSEVGMRQGAEVFYYPTSVTGRRAAEIIAKNLRQIYPGSVVTLPTTYLGEVRRTRAPGVLVEFAYHDNPDDAQWIRDNIDAIAQNVVLSLTEFFGIPFIYPQPPQTGEVDVSDGSHLNIRSRPDYEAPVVAKAPDEAQLSVLGEWQGWYVVNYNGVTGYASAQYIEV